MKYAMLVVFIITTSIHLYASIKSDKPLRDKTKPYILLSLLGFYVYSVEHIELTIVLALIFSWIGDMFLILKGVKWFAVGGVSFMISHFFFILSYAKTINFENIKLIYVLVLGIFFFITVSIIFSKLKGHLPRGLFYPMYLYLLINGAMNCFAVFRFISNVELASIITVVGACLFFISDSALFFVRFKKDSILKTHFLVMLTYSIGEFLIVLGLILGQGGII